jgi:capsule polysaccharide export protein KpsE/RkpR
LAILSLFPQPEVGRARILPRDPSNALGAVFGASGDRLQDLGVLFGGGAKMIDLYLAIGQSADIRIEVVKKLKLVGPSAKYSTEAEAIVDLDRKVDVQSLPGGLIQIQAKTHDADFALKLTQAYTEEISRQLRSINTEQVGVKQKLLDERFQGAASRLVQTQAALNEFRRLHSISAAPEAELGSAIAVKSGIEARLQAKLVELKTLQQMLGPDNPLLRKTETDVQGLRQQLALTVSPSTSPGGPNAGRLTELSTQYLDRYRDYLFAQSVYQVYTRLLEQAAVEGVSDRTAPTMQFVEMPHIEPGLHYNVWAVAALALLGLIFSFTEFYAPATGITLRAKSETGDNG